MDGLPHHHHHPMFGRGGVPPSAAQHQGFADPLLLHGRYAGMEPLIQQELMCRQDLRTLAAASFASVAPPIDDNASLLAFREEELAWLDDARDRIVEVDLARQNAASDMRNRATAAQAAQDRFAAIRAAQAARIAHAARAAQAHQAAWQAQQSHAAQLQAAAEERFSHCNDASRAALPSAGHPPRGLAEEIALRDRFRRRVMEEEAISNLQEQQAAAGVASTHQTHGHLASHQQRSQRHQQQGVAGLPSSTSQWPPSRDAELHRLLQLQHMSDEDLVKYAAEVQSLKRSVDQKDQDFALQAHSPALQNQNSAKGDTLERGKGTLIDQQQLMEARLFRDDHPGSTSQFQEAAGAGQDWRRDLGMMDRVHADMATSSGFSSKSEAGHQSQTSPTHRQHPTSPQDNSNRSGISRTMPTENGHTPAPSLTNASDAPSPSVGQLPSLDDNIIAKFLTMVVSHVPEIAPTVATLLPEGCDPVLLKREFPKVVDATLTELGLIRERLATASDAAGVDLLRRVVNCVAEIEPYKAELSNAGGMAALPLAPGVARQELSLTRGIPRPEVLLHPATAAGMMVPLLPPGVPPPMAAEMMRRHPLPTGVMHPSMVAGLPPCVPHHMWPLPPDVAAEMMRCTLPVPVVDPRNGLPLVPNMHYTMAGATPEELAMIQQAHRANAALMQQARQVQAALNSNLSNPIADAGQFTPLLKKEPSKPSSPGEDTPMVAPHKIKKKEAVKLIKKASKKKKNCKPKLVHHALFRGALNMNTEERREVLRRKREAKRERTLVECSKEELAKDGEELAAKSGEGGTGFESKTGINEGSINSVVTEESKDQVMDHAADSADQSREEEDGHFGAASVLLDLMGK